MTRSIAAVSMILLCGCGDIVVGRFPIELAGDSSAASGESGGSTGVFEVPLPGGCVDEAFDGATEHEPWIAWADADGSIEANAGVLTFVPPTSPELGTGLVLDDTYAFGFATARARVEVITPPDPASESELFLQVPQHVPMTQGMLSLAIYQGAVRNRVLADDGTLVEARVVSTTVPRWIGIRREGGTVLFEGSADGAAWQTLATVAAPGEFDGAAPLVMVWNNTSGVAIDPQPVVVDNFSICAD